MKQSCRIALGLVLWVSVLHAEVRIEITQGTDSTDPIGVIPFTWAGSNTLPENISQIIAADLRNSGKFNPLDITRLPQQPTIASEVTPEAWVALGINTIVVGQVKPAANSMYFISYQLVDTTRSLGNILIQNQYKVTKKWLRYSAHTISDEIFKKLVGIKGAFHTRIAYIVQSSTSAFPYELRVADYDGYNQFVVHHSPELLMSPAWSPDGNEVAFVTFERGHSALVIKNLTNGAIRQIAAFPRHNGAPAFSPDGSHLAFALSKNGSLNLYMMNLRSGQIKQITNERSNNTEPTWFPDGQTLAYTSDQGGKPQIYKISTSGGVSQRLTWEGSQNQNAKITADGNFLVMVSSKNGVQHIATQDLKSGSVKIITDTLLDETPSIAPNDTMVIYSAIYGMRSTLQLISTDGHFKKHLPIIDGQVTSPSWSPYL
ncbi:Tol-Pal system beta propeller repeat protein TolB [Candidatus Gillettellia adelgis]